MTLKLLQEEIKIIKNTLNSFESYAIEFCTFVDSQLLETSSHSHVFVFIFKNAKNCSIWLNIKDTIFRCRPKRHVMSRLAISTKTMKIPNFDIIKHFLAKWLQDPNPTIATIGIKAWFRVRSFTAVEQTHFSDNHAMKISHENTHVIYA